jgi:hypothetical protein
MNRSRKSAYRSCKYVPRQGYISSPCRFHEVICLPSAAGLHRTTLTRLLPPTGSVEGIVIFCRWMCPTSALLRGIRAEAGRATIHLRETHLSKLFLRKRCAVLFRFAFSSHLASQHGWCPLGESTICRLVHICLHTGRPTRSSCIHSLMTQVQGGFYPTTDARSVHAHMWKGRGDPCIVVRSAIACLSHCL